MILENKRLLIPYCRYKVGVVVKVYICKNAVVMIVFNRPDNAQKVFNEVKKVCPPRLYIVADGARDNQEVDTVNRTRQFLSHIDWECEVHTIFSDVNLGCKKRVITGISAVFDKEEQAIILEDDCVPTEEFFRYQDWALNYFKNNDRIAIVSGSNLLDYKYCEEYRNGFSQYINCWGWGTWKRVWNKYDPYLSIQEINKNYDSVVDNAALSKLQKHYWKYIFRHSIYSRTIWDFYMQYFFFKYDWRSVYPAKNLVLNIGFGEDSTHMKHEPEYIKYSVPAKNVCIMNLPILDYSDKEVNRQRDEGVIRILYGYSFKATVKLFLGNMLRYLGIRK